MTIPKLKLGAFNLPTRSTPRFPVGESEAMADPRYDQSGSLPDAGKGDRNVIEQVAPPPFPEPYSFTNVRGGTR